MKQFLKGMIDYYRDNPEGYWFKRKLYGWGWVPVTWEGWIAILVFISFITWAGIVLDANPAPSAGSIAWFCLEIIISLGLLAYVCYKKGEKPGWQWGRPDSKK